MSCRIRRPGQGVWGWRTCVPVCGHRLIRREFQCLAAHVATSSPISQQCSVDIQLDFIQGEHVRRRGILRSSTTSASTIQPPWSSGSTAVIRVGRRSVISVMYFGASCAASRATIDGFGIVLTALRRCVQGFDFVKSQYPRTLLDKRQILDKP